MTCAALVAASLRAEDSGLSTRDTKLTQQRAQNQKFQESKNAGSISHELKQGVSPKESQNEETASRAIRSIIITVKLALLADQRTARSTIEVELKGQEVMLSGKVATETERLAAAEVSSEVEGVKSVSNKLEVDKDLHHAMGRKRDQSITEYIGERFKKSATLRAAGFEIKTEDGVVELSGKTRFQVLVLEAAEAARQVPGVKAVKTTAVHLE